MEKQIQIKLPVTIKVLTGLHIGGSGDKMGIGGIDSSIIKDPVTGFSYIPGSSLKGKLRSLLELHNDESLPISNYFGCTQEDLKSNKNTQSPTRFIFRDLHLDEEWEKKYSNKHNPFSNEIKAEVKINRSSGVADEAGPRFIERVPRGVVFKGYIILRIFYTDGSTKEDNSKSEAKSILEKAKELISQDYLGGSGSRGYGEIEMTIDTSNLETNEN
jgi:CRISPR-associated protein Csm3